MKTISMVITNSGDGSNGVRWVTDPDVLDIMEERADDGDETYASGDGLQVTGLGFPDDFDMDRWMKLNCIKVTTVEDFE
jgi:hypothetical protein